MSNYPNGFSWSAFEAAHGSDKEFEMHCPNCNEWGTQIGFDHRNRYEGTGECEHCSHVWDFVEYKGE